MSLPLPVVALFVVGLLAAAGFAMHGLYVGRATEAGGEKTTTVSTGLADLRPLPEVRLRLVKPGEPERGSGQ